MSTPDGTRDDLLDAVARATRRVSAQGVLFSEAVAQRFGLASTDVECLELLAEAGALTAGRLAELTALTTGAATRMIDRLEQAGYVRRVPDPADRRRVIVEPVPARVASVRAFFDTVADATRRLGGAYREDDLRIIAGYLERALEVARTETEKVRAATAAGSEHQDASFAAPVGPATSGRLVFLSGAPNVTLRGDPGLSDLYRARFEGPVPRVRVRGGVVTIHYPRFSWFDWRARLADMSLEASVHWRRDRGEIALNATLPWDIELRGGASRLNGDLTAIDLRSLELSGGASKVDLALPAPGSIVPIRVIGGVSDVTLRRPAGTAVRLRVSGGASRVSLDDQQVTGVGDLVLELAGVATSPGRYEIEVRGGASRVVVGLA